MVFLDPVLSPLLQPLLDSSPFLSILVMALVISLLITLVYKFLTNQGEMKSLKEKQKDFQKRMKELRSSPEEMMKVQKEAMKVNMEYMKHSFKPTLITMLPIILIFGWMSAHLMYEPISMGDRFSVSVDFAEGVNGEAELLVKDGLTLISDSKQEISGSATWNLKGDKDGTHILTVKTSNDEESKKVLVTDEFKYEQPISTYQNSGIEKIKINYEKLRPLNRLVNGELAIFGWQPGWLGVYIMLSIIFSISLRKVLKIH